MTTIGQLKALFTAESGDFRKEVQRVSDDLRAVGKSGKEGSTGVGKLGGALDSLNGMAANLIGGATLAGIAAGAVKLGKDSIKAASDVQEMQSKFRIVFAETADGVEEELARFGDAVGRSKYELMGYASTLQDTFVPLGFARDQAAEMSIQVTKLAVDLASFNNLNTADVVRDLQSALVGNTETLRKYGVVANETSIKQYALNAGLWDGQGAMDAQTKAAVILQMAMEGNADAMGDAERTAGSYANQSRALEAAVYDLKVALGEALLPAATGVVGVLRDAAETAGLLVTWQARLAAAADEATQAALEQADGYGDFAAAALHAADVAGELNGVNVDQALAAANAQAALEELEKQYGTLTDQGLLMLYQQGEITAEQYNQMSETMSLAASWRDLAASMEIPPTAQAFEALRGDLGLTAGAMDGYIEAQRNAQTATEEMARAAADAPARISLLQGALDGAIEKFDAAKAAAGLLSDGIRQISEDAADQARIMAVLEIAQGNLTQAEIEERLNQVQQLDMLSKVNQALEDDKITRYEWLGIVADGVVTQEELNAALGASVSAVQAVGNAVKGIDGLSAQLSVDVNITKHGSLPPEATGHGWEGGGKQKGAGKAAFATGTPPGGFVVPPGYPHDSYPVWVSSGERVIVEPPGRASRGPEQKTVVNETYNITVTDSGAAALMMAMIDERRRARVLEGV